MVKNSRNHFKHSLVKSLLLMGNICSQICGENSFKRMGKNWLKALLKSCYKTMTKPPNLQARKNQPLGYVRPAGRPSRSTANGQESDRWSLRSTARSTQKNREHCSQFRSTPSVDRPSARSSRARRARRSTEPVDRLQPQSTCLVDQSTWLKPETEIWD